MSDGIDRQFAKASRNFAPDNDDDPFPEFHKMFSDPEVAKRFLTAMASAEQAGCKVTIHNQKEDSGYVVFNTRRSHNADVMFIRIVKKK